MATATTPGSRGSASDPESAGSPERVIAHVDMDAFFAAVATRDRPDLAGRPVVIGGEGRGVVLSATYPARVHGIRSGMPMSRARRLCPDAVILRPDHDELAEASAGFFAILDTCTDIVEAASMEEAYCDITGTGRRLGGPEPVGERIRALVHDEQQITCSVGIGPNRFVAKMASAAIKPDGLLWIRPGDVVSFLHPLPVDQMFGVGPTTAEQLHRLGLHTIADLAHTPRETLRRALGPRSADRLADLAWGHDPTPIRATPAERSMGCDRTFGRDTDDPATIDRELLRVADTVAHRLRVAGLRGRVVTLGVRFADFRDISRSVTLPHPVDTTIDIHQRARALYAALRLERPRIRRLGIRIEQLVDATTATEQPTLTEPDHGWRDAETAADAVIRRFGPGAVRRASLTGH